MSNTNIIAIPLSLLLLVAASSEWGVVVSRDAAMKIEVAQEPEQSSAGELTTKEKELLNCLMFRLKREPSATGWIRMDLERRGVDEPALTDLVVRYLKSKHNAEFDRVSVMGAYGLPQEMELLTIPRGGDPIPFPGKTSKSKCSKRARSK